MKTRSVKIRQNDSLEIADIKIKLFFNGELIAESDGKRINDILNQIRAWSRLYALKRWADKTKISIDFNFSTKDKFEIGGVLPDHDIKKHDGHSVLNY